MRTILFCSLYISICLAEVKFLLAVWRHGDRAPENLPYPKDPHNETFWPRGWNQLTNIGIDQATKLGTFLRRRYHSTVIPKFDRKKIEIRASDADRAIETAQAVAITLFPPTGKQMWTEKQFRFWQPIPIRSNGETDPMLRPSKIKCPEYKRIVLEERRIVEAQTNKKYRKELEIISNRTDHYTRYANIKDVYNVILEHYNGLPFPEWASEIVNGRSLLDTIVEIRRISRLQLFNTQEKSKFMAGYLINSWATSLEDVSSGKSSKKALLYSSHDGTLSSLLYGLNISNDQLAPYTACVMVELHADNTVKIFLRNTTTENPDDAHELFVPNCKNKCHLPEFLEKIANVRVRNMEQLDQICKSSSFLVQTFNFCLFVIYFFL